VQVFAEELLQRPFHPTLSIYEPEAAGLVEPLVALPRTWKGPE
jgi:hypothetical protein